MARCVAASHVRYHCASRATPLKRRSVRCLLNRRANFVFLTLLCTFGCHVQTLSEIKEIRAVKDLSWLSKRLESYRLARGTFPQDARYEDLQRILGSPLPLNDSWSSPFKYEVSGDGKHFRVSSAGADRQFEVIEPLPHLVSPEVFSDFARDIVVQDGQFVRFHKCSASAVPKSGT